MHKQTIIFLKIFGSYFALIFCITFNFALKSQVNAPSLRCVSVNTTNDIVLTWIIPSDPNAEFFSYEIYHSPTQVGTYSLIGTVSTYNQNSFTHIGANGSTQSQYYYLITKSNGGANSSSPSDTLRSIFLNLNAPASGINTISWNKTRNPLLPSASTIYTVKREFPFGTWTTIYSGSLQSFKDTITRCSVYYNYIIETSDSQGCTSTSNITGGLFHDGQSPKNPLLDSVSVNSNGLSTLGWNPTASSGATRYVIYKFLSGIWTAIDTVNGGNSKSYIYGNSLATSESETFCIAAIDSCKNITILGQGQSSIYLTNKYDLCSRTANLNWTAYSNLPQGISKYEIYYAINGGNYLLAGSTNNTSFSHSNLNPNDTYCYFIRVVNSTGNITASSNESCLMAKAPSGPSYIYINSVSVNASSQIDVTYTVDNSQLYKGAAIFKSVDGGLTFKQISYQNYSPAATIVYTDADVSVNSKSYYYKIQLSDSCGNPSFYSNTSKSILLKVSNDNESVFNNNLSWDDYASWSGTINSYNIYRGINNVFAPTPIANVPLGTNNYTDNIEEFANESGLFSYYIEAIEDGTTNIYGFNDKANSNIANAYAEVEVFTPNTFAPGGLNALWMPVAQFIEKTDYLVTVFDRWGTKVFETNSDKVGWDGKNTTDDVFVYLINYKNARGEFIQLKGHITLLR